MRPVNKGQSPYERISHYREAAPYLLQSIGEYCCFCEMPISHAPEVEHVVSKSKGGDETAWKNLLLACKYCNSRKGKKITPDNVNNYMWPDCDNTAVAYSYDESIPVVNREMLNHMDPSGHAVMKANNLYELVQLGNKPRIEDKDKRYWKREETRDLAEELLQLYENIETNHDSHDALKKIIVDTAYSTGFFSVWMTVFKRHSSILLGFMERFPGTQRKYYDDVGQVRPIIR